MAAIGASVVTAVLSTALPLLVSEIKARTKDKEVVSSFESLELSMGMIIGRVSEYHNRFKYRSEWKDKVTRLKHLANEIEECVDRFKIGKTSNTQLAGMIKSFRKSLDKQHTELGHYISQGHLVAQGRQHVHVENNQVDADEHAAVGMTEALLDLRALVLDTSNLAEKQPKVISIVGHSGVGKTRLADALFYGLQYRDFPLRSSVRATGKNKNEVLEEILRELHSCIPGSSTQGPPTAITSQQLMVLICNHLKSCPGNTRYVIMIDDVQEVELGDYVISKFRQATEASGVIILTTTVQKVAKMCSSDCGQVFKMRPLSAEESGQLFSGSQQRLSAEHSRIIVNESDGMPLAVICLAEFSGGDIEKCKTAWGKLCDPEEGIRLERMLRVLSHSYESLPSIDLQTCLLYFSMFAREHPVRRGSLVRRWLAEGAEVGCGNVLANTNSHAATRNISSLLDRNVILPIQVSIDEDEEAKTCRPQRAMLRYISHVSEPEGFARVCSEPCGTQVIRRLSLQTGDGRILEKEGAVSRLRTLVVSPGGNVLQAVSRSTSLNDKARKFRKAAATAQRQHKRHTFRCTYTDAFDKITEDHLN